MTPNSDWWDRAKTPPRPQPIEIRKRERLCALVEGERESPSSGDRCSVSVRSYPFRERALRRMRVFKQNPLGMLTASVAATVSSLEAKGWQVAAAVLLVVVVARVQQSPCRTRCQCSRGDGLSRSGTARRLANRRTRRVFRN